MKFSSSDFVLLFGSIGWRNQEETATFEEEKKSFFIWKPIISYIKHCTGKKHKLGFKSLPHPPYSPNLAPSDYYLSPNLKRRLRGRHFESNEEDEWETEGYFGRFDKSYYLEGIEKLKDRWNRYIELKGEYIEKKNWFLLKRIIFVHFIMSISNTL